MKPYIANLINAITLIGLGLWGYYSNEPADRSLTALIAPAFGVIFILCTPLMKKENKAVAHIVVLLTLVLIIALIKPLTSNISSGDNMGILRIGMMIVTSVIAMVSFIKSFIDARKAREA